MLAGISSVLDLCQAAPSQPEQDPIFPKFLREFPQEDIHTIGIAVGHDQKEAFSRKRLYGAVSIAVFADVKAGNVRSNAFPAPAVFGLGDPAESGFVLEHQSDFA